MDLYHQKFFYENYFSKTKKNLNKLSDGHGNIVFEPLGHRQKYGNDGFCVNKQTPEPQLILLQTSI